MIRIFSNDDHRETVVGWTETNQISKDVESVEAAAGLGIENFPAVVDVVDGAIKTNYAEGHDAFFNLPLETINTIRQAG